MKTKNSPPSLPLRFFRWFCHPDLLPSIEGDLMELFNERTANIDQRSAKWLFVWDVIKLFRPSIIRPIADMQRLNNYGMFKVYLKFAARDIKKSKLIAAGSLASLSIGVLCFYMIFLWVQTELSMDQFHSNSDRIHLVAMQQSPLSELYPYSSRELPIASSFPEVDNSLKIRNYTEDNILLQSENREFRGKGLVVDSTFFDFFDFEVLVGDQNLLLKDISHIVLTKSFAERMFGDEDPIGKVVTVKCDRIGLYSVQGIVEDVPTNSSFDFEFLIPTSSKDGWSWMPIELVMVNDSFVKEEFNKKLTLWVNEQTGNKEAVWSLVPFASIYFDHPFRNNFFSKVGDQNDVLTMAIVGLIILVISVLNFTNIQATHMVSQIKSNGIKKVNGANKFDLNNEVLVSRLLYALASAILALVIFNAILPQFLYFLNFEIQSNIAFDFLKLFGLSILCTFISLPILMSQSSNSANPLLSNDRYSKINLGITKRTLTTIQYTCSIILIISSIAVYQQFDHMVTKDLGYDYKNIISVKLFDEISVKDAPVEEYIEQRKNHGYVYAEALSNPDLFALTQGTLPLNRSAHPMKWKLMGSDVDYVTHHVIGVDPGYKSVLDLQMSEGRFFSDSLDKKGQDKLVLNEAAVRHFGIKDITTAIIYRLLRNKGPYQVIGIVKDYHFEDLSQKVKPLIMVYSQFNEKNFQFKINGSRFDQSISSLEAMFTKLNPAKKFDYKLLKDEVMAQYEKEKRLSSLIFIFALVGLTLSAIGLFTFALYETQRRVKEIGIRKTLGASFESILSLLALSFLKWVVLAFVFACPIAWYFLGKWLENYATRILFDWKMFVLAGFMAISVAFLAIAWQTMKSARCNPVDSLRYE